MKKSFTLIEVLVSITILSIIVVVMSQVISSVRISKDILQTTYKQSQQYDLAVKLLYNDIVNAGYINIVNDNKNYSILEIRTKNSIYNIPYPYVLYYVSKKNNTLIRLSSAHPISIPVTYEFENFYILPLLNKVKIFKIYSKSNKYLIYLQKNKPFYFEFQSL